MPSLRHISTTQPAERPRKLVLVSQFSTKLGRYVWTLASALKVGRHYRVRPEVFDKLR
jgi:hypothetical protein